MKKFITYHLPTISYAVAIIILSSIPGFNHKYIIISGYDKLIHFSAYAIFAVLIFRSVSHITKKISLRTAGIISLAFILVFAICDELYQSTTPGRRSDPYDVLFDFLGAAAIIIFVLLCKKKQKR